MLFIFSYYNDTKQIHFNGSCLSGRKADDFCLHQEKPFWILSKVFGVIRPIILLLAVLEEGLSLLRGWVYYGIVIFLRLTTGFDCGRVL